MEFLAHLPTLTSFALTLMLTLVLPSLMERLRLPGPVGYILAGIILGPQVLAVLNPDGKIVQFFADIGKLLLMFFAGFEVDIEQFNRARRKAGTFGLLTFSAPFLLGVAVGWLMGYPPNACAVIGAVLASHTLLGLPVVKAADLVHREAVVVTVGATVFTDLLSIFVLAVCLPIHVSGFDPRNVLIELFWLAVYVPAVLIGLSWLAARMLERFGKSKANRALIMLVVMAVAAQGAELIGLEGIIGAFLAGVALKRAFGSTPSDDSLEVMSQTLFIPIFFVAAGFLVDFKVFFATLRDQPLLVLGILGALFGGKWLAAQIAGRALGYGVADRQLMYALTIPQVAATLAVALVAYSTRNPAGQRLIDEPVLNATVVLVILSSLIGLILTGRVVKRLQDRKATATAPREAS
ncbi:MAG: cation:proton antiporter [Reyranella sp.]|uniref:cation:proton antiporter n=1 Tax=Reyranella sp. TaxID=1929291 RepID=UPI0025FDC19D|nr:cation:proton antiporter [Reyranella sp.]MBR2814301.1 cation:proton antiporter [Reyranella sp.]